MRMNTSLVALAAIILVSIGFAACGQGDDERSAGIIHRLLLSSLQDPDRLQSFPGELPPDLPADFPVYPDGDLVVSSRELRAPEGATEEPAAGDPATALFFILIDTADSPADVFSYYEEALDEDPWQVEETGATSKHQSIGFTLVADPDVSGIVVVARGRDEDRTTIVVSIQDAGAEQIEAPEFELPESLLVPAQFPKDLPLYEGAIITSSAFLREPGRESIEMTFLSEDGQTDVVDFYRNAFDEMGWDVEAATGGGLGDRLIFSDSEGSLNGALQADRFADDRDYTQVAITLQQDSNREPGSAETPEGGDGETPEGNATPEDETPTS